MADVTLSYAEVTLAAHVGVMRRISAIKRGRKGNYDCVNERDGWTWDIRGAIAECAVAKHTGTYWFGKIDDLSHGDVGDLEVRSTVWPTGHLLIHPEDPDDKKFILVLENNLPVCTLAGWIYGHEGKDDTYWTTKKIQGKDRSAFFVPQKSLRPVT